MTIIYLQIICIGMIALHCVLKLMSQVTDLFVLGLQGYITSFNSVFELILLLVLGFFIYYASLCMVDELNTEINDDHRDNMRIVFIAATIIVNI